MGSVPLLPPRVPRPARLLQVAAVRWSPSRPCAFYVLDALCNLYALDLLSKTRMTPVSTETYMTQVR